MKGKNLIMCGLCACIGFIGGEVRAYLKVLNELRTMERPKVTYLDYYDKRQRRVDRCVFQNRAEAEKVLEEMIKITPDCRSVPMVRVSPLMVRVCVPGLGAVVCGWVESSVGWAVCWGWASAAGWAAVPAAEAGRAAQSSRISARFSASRRLSCVFMSILLSLLRMDEKKGRCAGQRPFFI